MQIQEAIPRYIYSNNVNNEEKSITNFTKGERIARNYNEKDNATQLDENEQRIIRELQSIDTKVRAHEMAHIAAGGKLTGAANYTYTKGPDNKMYAISGEVPISVQKGNTPEETINNARQIRAAAMAPANPSPQDYRVAASALQMEVEAKAELIKLRAENDANSEEKEADGSSNENTLKIQAKNVYKQNHFGNKTDFTAYF